MQMAQSAPQLYDLAYLHRQMLEVLGIKNFEKIIPTPEDMRPVDPVSENMNIMNGKPVKAFMYQDHQAHIGVHMAAMKDPKLAAIMGQNPQAQAIMGAAQAHVMEHVAFQYRREIEKQLGAALPPMHDKDSDDDSVLPPELEVQLSQLASQAAAQLLQINSAEAQMQQNQQAAQDPLLQLQQQELQIKAQDVQRKSKKDIMDAAGKADALKLKEVEIEGKQQVEGMKLGVEIQKHKAQLASQEEAEGTRMGVDIAKHKAQMQADNHAKGVGMGVDVAKHQSQLAHQQQMAELNRKQT
jgi:hypothetical protein